MGIFPGLALMLTVLTMNLLGDWLHDYLDPPLPPEASGREAAERRPEGRRGARLTSCSSTRVAPRPSPVAISACCLSSSELDRVAGFLPKDTRC